MTDIVNSVTGFSYNEAAAVPFFCMYMTALNYSAGVDMKYRKGLQDCLDNVRSLQQGWDGHGGLPITVEAYNNAKNILFALSMQDLPDPEITPSSNGTICLEWESDRGEAFIELGKTKYSGYIELCSGAINLLHDSAGNFGIFQLKYINDLLFKPTSATSSLTI